MKKILSLVLALAMIVSMGACFAESSAGEVPYVGEVELYNAEAANVGLCTGWMPDYIREAAGVDMIGIAYESGKFELMVASGSLPDVCVIGGVDNLGYAIDAELLLDLTEVMDKLPNLSKYEENTTMMQYVRDNCSNGTGALYGLNRMFCESEVADMDIGGIFLRYDYYGEIGYPELKGYDDLLNALAAMQEKHPTTAEGQKVYGMSLFTDWDNGLLPFWGYMARSMGFTGGLVERDYHNYKNDGNVDDIVMRSALADDSGYKAFLKFLNKAYNMGLLDPDSVTQTFDDSKNKTATGRALLSFDNWNTEYSAEDQNNGIGFRRVPNMGEPYVADDCSACPGGTHTFITISKDCKNLDAACALINLMYDPEFTVNYMNGTRGHVWDQKEDGTPYMLEEGYTNRANLDFSKRGCIIMLTYHFSAPLPGFNGYSTDYTQWPAQEWTPEDNLLVKNWKEHTVNGYGTAYAYMKSIDMYRVPPAALGIQNTDDMQMIVDRVNAEIKVANWKLMYATGDEEFDAIWTELQQTCEGMGLERYIEWWIEQYKAACEGVAPYVKY